MKYRCVVWWDEAEGYWHAATVEHQQIVFGTSIMKAIANLKGNLGLELAFAIDECKNLAKHYRSYKRRESSIEDQFIFAKSREAEPVPSANDEVDIKKSYYSYVSVDHRRFKTWVLKRKKRLGR